MPGPLTQKAAHVVYRSKTLAKMMFGIEFPALGPKDYYFDISTYLVVKHVSRVLSPKDHLLDLGTGSFGVIGLSLWKKTGCTVTSCDINPELVASTRKNVELNRAPIQVYESNLFANVPVSFNVVTFNPPYITSSVGKSWGIDARPGQWDGGEDGTAAVGPFLEAVAARPNQVTAYLAMNTLFVKGDKIRDMIAKEPGLKFIRTITSSVLPIDIHVMENRSAAKAPNSPTPRSAR
jgi:methylase of polypeptide subunit release factors